MAESSRWIVEVTNATFERDVLEHSKRVPVVVDFWAPWCGPCRALTPILEKLAGEFAGQFLLAKANIDENQQLAAEFRVQSIPYVLAFRDGRPVDGFLGVLPEDGVREWIGRIVPSEVDQLVARGHDVVESAPDEAERLFREALQLDPAHAGAKMALAQLLVQRQRLEEAAALISELEQRGFLEPEAQRVKAEIELRRGADAAGGAAEARKAWEQNPGNLELQLRLAEALAAEGELRQALELSVGVVEIDRGDLRARAKDLTLKILSLAENQDPELAGEFRRRLASALY